MIFIHIYGSPKVVYAIVGLYCDTQTLNLMYVRWVPDTLEPIQLQYLYPRSFRLFEPCSRRSISKNDGQLFYMFSLKKNTKKCMVLCETDFNFIVFYPISFCWIIYIIIWLINLRLYDSLIWNNLEVKEGSWNWMSI